MESIVQSLLQALQQLVGSYRQLFEVVRDERESLVSMDVKKIEENTHKKELIVEDIFRKERDRRKTVQMLAKLWNLPEDKVTISQIVLRVQGSNIKLANEVESMWRTLDLQIKRTSEQNQYNRELLEKSLAHLESMKQNILGASAAKSETYNPYGKKSTSSASSEPRVISREA